MAKTSEGVATGAANGDQTYSRFEDSSDDNEWLIISKRDGKTRVLPRRMIFVGREECDIVLRSTTVDKRHAVIFFNQQSKQFHIKDLNTSYGTYINDKRIADQCYVRLTHSDRLRFGFGPDLFIIEKASSTQPINENPTTEKISTDSVGDSDPKDSLDVIVDKITETNAPKSDQTFKDKHSDGVPALIARRKSLPITNRSLPNSSENHSNSSLSTVDSLDEIKSSKHSTNNCVLNTNKETIDEMKEIERTPEKCSTTTPASPVPPTEGMGASPSGPATAFIIAFDFDEKSNKKKMNIKDSIRQFAPPKPDSIEKPRPSKSGKTAKNSETNNSFRSRKSPTFGSNASKTTNRAKSAHSCEPNDSSGHLSDSASYLINRMFFNEKDSQTNMNSNGSGDKCWPNNGGERDSGVSDDKSEAGTYTVELERDQNNQDLEVARKKIDEIFGVYDDSTTISLNSSPDSSLNSPTLLLSINEKQSKIRQSFPSPKFRPKFTSRDCEPKQKEQTLANNTTFTRTKRRAPTVEEMLHRFDPKEDNEKRRDSYDSNHSKSVLNQNSYNSSHKESQKPVVSQSVPNTPRSPLVSRKITELQTNKNRRKNSWSHSNSDFDYYESYNSDESTDKSHKSSNSGISKDGGSTTCSSVPSKMRYNRAFALRRARLGIETPGIDLNKTLTNNNTRINTSANSGTNWSKQALHQRFNRSDGGRFSLRVAKNDLNSGSTNQKKIQNVSNNRISSKDNNNKNGLQRKSSDPSGANSITNRWTAMKSCVSDTDRNSVNNNRVIPWSSQLRQNLNNSRNSINCENNLHKSSSFADSKANSDHNSRGSCRTPVANRRHGMQNISKGQQMSTQSGTDTMTSSLNEPFHKPPISSPQHKNKSGLELTALDSLVVSAVNQLTIKLKTKVQKLLESQRLKHEINSEAALMIDEILPQLSSERLSSPMPGLSVSRDLSAILKNLKKLEQSFDAVALLLDPNSSQTTRPQTKNSFFVVDV